MTEVQIRPVKMTELSELWHRGFSNPQAEWLKWNGPYFHDRLPQQTDFETIIGPRDWVITPRNWIITVDGTLVGGVNYHFVDGDLKRWLEVGIIIYDEQVWGHQVGRQALTLWLDHLFATMTVPHLGLTTWSGNQRMMQLAVTVGLNLEARIPQVRYWQGHYYDSLKYGILRTDWQKLRQSE
ncbi:GNAT family N-acetyltransferase [Lactobacillus sp. CBA3605]|uniref:GNAT family N-acetyltransferase n=1 Tax=Lactobacillus sp. CBA3605 TaxID=2099788 RepID=UPI000CFB68E9|nr:GNAT family protein [Lactobacillus sp. CBA3605]AVK61107.1 GNAT family N-acetyltransferase [Lactobacillus sp. CBA3605]